MLGQHFEVYLPVPPNNIQGDDTNPFVIIPRSARKKVIPNHLIFVNREGMLDKRDDGLIKRELKVSLELSTFLVVDFFTNTGEKFIPNFLNCFPSRGRITLFGGNGHVKSATIVLGP